MTNANMQEKNLNGGGKPSKRKEEEDSNPMNGVTASGCETSGIPKKDYSRSKAGSNDPLYTVEEEFQMCVNASK